jgi:hypothetical protein
MGGGQYLAVARGWKLKNRVAAKSFHLTRALNYRTGSGSDLALATDSNCVLAEIDLECC